MPFIIDFLIGRFVWSLISISCQLAFLVCKVFFLIIIGCLGLIPRTTSHWQKRHRDSR